MGVAVVNSHEIAICENNVVLGFRVTGIKLYGEDYKLYYCVDKDKKKVKFLTVGENKNKKKFQLIFSTSSNYWKIDLVKIE